MKKYFDTNKFYQDNKDDEETIRRFNMLTDQLKGLPFEKQEEILESVAVYCELLYQCEGLPLEQQKELYDDIQDEKLLEFLEDRKKSLS